MQNDRVGSLLVKKGKDAVGILTETDIVQKVVAEGLDPSTTVVGDIMSAPLLTVEAKQSVVEADELMERNRIRHLAVLDKGKVVGVVSVRDLLFPLQYLLAFADVDLEKASVSLDDEAGEKLRITPKGRPVKKSKSSRRR
jgi:signal-transduction protein with cAMP-binding, CBS, and nucleotidyltransferase domain